MQACSKRSALHAEAFLKDHVLPKRSYLKEPRVDQKCPLRKNQKFVKKPLF